jgi:DNA-binding transcriptional regulator LsrR (DeoR family)
MAPIWSGNVDHEDVVVKCVRAYVDEFRKNPMEPTLQHISKIVGCSRNLVKAHLATAVRDHLLSLVVRLPKEQELSRAVQNEYQITEAVVTSPSTDWHSQHAIRAALAPESMRYLERCALRISESGGRHIRVGFDGGQTLHQAVREVTCSTWPALKYELVPLVFGPLEGSKWSATVVANILASKIEAAGLDVIVQDAFQVETDWKYPQESDTVRFVVTPVDKRVVADLDLLLVGIGSQRSGLYQREVLSQSNRRGGLPEHFGDTLNLAFDRHGNPLPSEARSRAVVLNLGDLNSLAIGRSTLVAGVAGGHEKLEAIRVTVQRRYVSVLITDSMTAGALVRRPTHGG